MKKLGKKMGLFFTVPLAYKEIIKNHYDGEHIIHDCDCFPQAFCSLHRFDTLNNVNSIFLFGPCFRGWLSHKFPPSEAPIDRIGIHYDGNMEEAKMFFDNFPVEWINGHKEYNDIRRVKKIADLLGIRNIALPNAYSDISSHNLVKDFLRRKGEDGFYTFHLDYFLFWHLSRVIR